MNHPLICFYKENLFFESTDYTIFKCTYSENPENFLEKLKLQHPHSIFILQTEFAAFLPQDLQKKLVKDSLTSLNQLKVYKLNEFSILSKEQLKEKYHHELSSSQQENIETPFFQPYISQSEFTNKVNSIIADIKIGRFYQINLTDQYQALISKQFNDFLFFIKKLLESEASYCAYLPDTEENILCFSPELFLKKEQHLLFTQPIKGTLKNNETLEELKNSEKENAELSMIVDLLRNDFNSLSCSQYQDSSRVSFHREIMNLKYTQHTYSQVEIKSSLDLPSILKKISPGGSISGCPKLESLIKISEIENNPRGFYTGSIGWWQNSDACLNLAIRSFTATSDKLTYYTGCGIVYDSKPQDEWQEFLTKASFINQKEEGEFILDTLLFEDNDFFILEHHIDRTYEALKFNSQSVTKEYLQKIYKLVEEYIKHNFTQGTYKVRLLFHFNQQSAKLLHSFNVIPHNNTSKEVSLTKVEFTQMNSTDLKTALHLREKILTIQNVGLIKTTNREYWNYLKTHQSNALADDYLIVNENNEVTETSRFILLFKEKNNTNKVIYITPHSSETLISTFKNYLLSEKRIKIENVDYEIQFKKIFLEDLKSHDIFAANSVQKIKKANLI